MSTEAPPSLDEITSSETWKGLTPEDSRKVMNSWAQQAIDYGSSLDGWSNDHAVKIAISAHNAAAEKYGAPAKAVAPVDYSGINVLDVDPAELARLTSGETQALSDIADGSDVEGRATARPNIHLPKPSGDSAIAGTTRAVESAIEGLTSTENMALMASMEGFPLAVRRAAMAGFASLAAKDIPSKYEEFKKAQTTGGKFEAGTGAAIDSIFMALGVHGALTAKVAPLTAKAMDATQPPHEHSTTVSDSTGSSRADAAQRQAVSGGSGHLQAGGGLPAEERNAAQLRQASVGGEPNATPADLAPLTTQAAASPGKVTQLLERRQKITDPEERQRLWDEAQAALLEKPPTDLPQGPGKMTLGELPPQETTGLKRVVVDTERLARGAEPIPTPERQREEAVVQAAEDKVDADSTVAPSLVARIVDDGAKAITEQDAAVLLVERNRLMYERRAWEAKLRAGEDVDIARTKLDDIEQQLNRLDHAQRAAGTTWGRLGHMYQRMIQEDYTLEAMESKERAVKGRPLNADERATIAQQAAKIAELQKVADTAEQARSEAAEAQRTTGVLEATIAELNKQPKFGKEVFDIAHGIVNRWKTEADASRKAFRQAMGMANVGFDPTLIVHVAKILRAKIGEFGLDKAEAFTQTLAELGAEAKPYLNKAWEKAQALIGKEKTGPKVKDAVKAGVKKQGEKTPVDIRAKAKAEAVAGEPLSHQTVYELVRAHINEGIHGEDALMKAAHKDVREFYPDASERDVRRAFSEYGEVKFPSKESDKVELRELRTLVRLQESIDRETAGLDSLHTGLQRDKATQAIREKQKTLNELLKKRTGSPSPEKLAGRDEARKTALKNQIEDLDKQLRTGEKPVSGTPLPDSPEVEYLKAQRDAMKIKLAEIEAAENPPLAEHLKQLADLQKQEAELAAKIAAGDIATKTGKPTVDTPEVAAAKERLSALRDKMAEMRKAARDLENPPKTDAEKQVDALSKIKTRLDETLSGARAPTAKTDFQPLSQAAEDIKLEITAMQELAAQMRRDAKPPVDVSARQEAAKIKALEAAIERYRARTAANDFTSAPKTHGPDTAKVAALKEVLASRKSMYDAAKAAGRPVLTPEQRYNRDTAKRVQKRMAELQAKIAVGDYSRPIKKPMPALDAANLKAKADLERVKTKFDQGVEKQRLANRTKSQKFWDAFIGIQRAMKLSSDVVLIKLSTAAFAREVLTPGEDIIGSGIGKLLPGLAARAPREGGFSIAAEAKAKTALFTEGMRDAWLNLKMKESNLESARGKPRKAEPAWYDYFGFLHGALKAPVKRAEFARSMEKRLEHAIRNGIDLSDPNTMVRLSQESYIDSNRAIFMQDNVVAEGWNALLGRMAASKKAPILGPTAARVGRFLVPIVKVPTNIVGEVGTGIGGLPVGAARALKAYVKGIDELPPEQADSIMRQMKKGSVGAGFMLLGYYGYQNIGGFYYHHDNRKQSDVPPGRYRMGGVDLPNSFSHTTASMLLNVGATLHRVMDEKHGTKAKAVGAALGGVAEMLPFVPVATNAVSALRDEGGFERYLYSLITSTATPSLTQHVAKVVDTPGSFPSNALQDATRRVPATPLDAVKMGVPGLRGQVPEKKKRR